MDRDALFYENQGLVNLALRRLGIDYNDGMFEDYRQVGYIGLLKAVRKFKPDLGFTFSTYAVPMIMGEIRREKRDHGNILKIPRQINEAYYHYRQLNEQGLNDQEICKELGVTAEKLNDIKGAYRPVAYLEEPHYVSHKGNDKVVSLGESISTKSNLEEECIGKVCWDQMFSNLTEEEKTCVELRSAEMTQEQIAKRMGMSQGWVSRTLIKAKKKLSKMLGGAA